MFGRRPPGRIRGGGGGMAGLFASCGGEEKGGAGGNIANTHVKVKWRRPAFPLPLPIHPIDRRAFVPLHWRQRKQEGRTTGRARKKQTRSETGLTGSRTWLLLAFVYTIPPRRPPFLQPQLLLLAMAHTRTEKDIERRAPLQNSGSLSPCGMSLLGPPPRPTHTKK